MDLYEAQIDCPHCWQSQTVFLDPSENIADLIEDCRVCCKPIEIQACFDEFDFKWIKTQEGWE